MPRKPGPWANPRNGLAYCQGEASLGWGSSNRLQFGPTIPPEQPSIPYRSASYPTSLPSTPRSFSAAVHGSLLAVVPPAIEGLDGSVALSEDTPSLGPTTSSPAPAEHSITKSELPSFDSEQLDKTAKENVRPLIDLANDQESLNGLPTRVELYRPVPAFETTVMVPLAQHLSNMFVTKDLTDWGITVSSPTGSFISTSYHVHGMIILRSPALRQLMREEHASGRRENVIHITSPDRYMQPPMFEAALRHLYDDTLLIKADIEEHAAGYFGPLCPPQMIRDYQFDCALSYNLAGVVLGMAAVRDRGRALIAEVLDWDILELAMSQTLSLAKPGMNVTVPPPRSTLTSTSHASSVADLPIPTFSKSPPPHSQHQALSFPNGATSKHHNTTIGEIVGGAIKQSIYNFIAKNLNLASFEIDTAPPKFLQSYLPAIREYSSSSRPAFNPALASTRFGNMPLPYEQLPSLYPQMPSTPANPENTAVSAILLNVSCDELHQFFENIKALLSSRRPSAINGLPQLRGFAETIVNAREQRRKNVVDSKTVSNEERARKQPLWNVAGWQESIQSDENADNLTGWKLARTWTGFEKSDKNSV